MTVQEKLKEVKKPIFSVPIIFFDIFAKKIEGAIKPNYVVGSYKRNLIVEAFNPDSAKQEAMNDPCYWQIWDKMPIQDRPGNPFDLAGEPIMISDICLLRYQNSYGVYLCVARKPRCGDCGRDIGGETCDMEGEPYGGCAIDKSCVAADFPGCLLNTETTYQKGAD